MTTLWHKYDVRPLCSHCGVQLPTTLATRQPLWCLHRISAIWATVAIRVLKLSETASAHWQPADSLEVVPLRVLLDTMGPATQMRTMPHHDAISHTPRINGLFSTLPSGLVISTVLLMQTQGASCQWNRGTRRESDEGKQSISCSEREVLGTRSCQ